MMSKNLTILVLLCVVLLIQLARSQVCGIGGENRSCSLEERCCSKFGWCGNTLLHCRSSDCQRKFGQCSPFDFSPSTGLNIGSIGPCGGENNSTECPEDYCCSKDGWCGNEEAYCGTGCQPFFGKCTKLVESRCQWPSSPSPELAIFPSQPFNNNQSNQHFQLCKRGFVARDPKASSIPVTCLSNGLWPTAIPNACVNNMNFNKKVKFVRSNVLVDALTDGRPLTCANVSQPLEIPLDPTIKIQDIRILFSKTGKDYAFTVSIDDVYTKNNTLINKYMRIFNERVDEKSKVVFPIVNIDTVDDVALISRHIRLTPISEMRICEIECAVEAPSLNDDDAQSKEKTRLSVIIGSSIASCLLFSFLVIALVLYICLRRTKSKRRFIRENDPRMPTRLPTPPEMLNSNNRTQSWFDDSLYEEMDLPDLSTKNDQYLIPEGVSSTSNNYANLISSNSPAVNAIHPLPK